MVISHSYVNVYQRGNVFVLLVNVAVLKIIIQNVMNIDEPTGVKQPNLQRKIGCVWKWGMLFE